MFIVYDTDYDDVLAKAASKRLMELGYENVYSLLGGLKAWKTEGYPVEKSQAPAVANPSGGKDAAVPATSDPTTRAR